ncbi:MAG: hypothetical protein JNL83_30035 [Myxococcales bacterium]|nr:hypothetical protein [Myxococcales bacterium]
MIGIGLALGTPEHSVHAILLLLNVVSLDVIGSLSILALRGVQRAHLDLEKRIREPVGVTLDRGQARMPQRRHGRGDSTDTPQGNQRVTDSRPARASPGALDECNDLVSSATRQVQGRLLRLMGWRPTSGDGDDAAADGVEVSAERDDQHLHGR